MKIEVDELGKLVYLKVYLEIDIPRLFLCTFDPDNKDVWIGVHVDEIDDTQRWSAGEGQINDYYLARIAPGQIDDLESGKLTLHELFTESPLLWISHRYSKINDKSATLHRWHARILGMYSIAKDATLNI